MFTAAYIRLAALVLQHERVHSIEIVPPRATMIERIQASLDPSDTAELLTLVIEESK